MEGNSNFTKDQVLARTRDSLKWIFNDICYARHAKANIGTMILSVLALENFALRRENAIEKHQAKTEPFESFVKEYLQPINEKYSRFHKRDPYGDLRSILVHYYSKVGFEFIDNPIDHLDERKGYLLLNVKVFSDDVETAINNYLEDLEESEENSEVYTKFKEAYETYPLLAEGVKGKPLIQD